MLQDTIRQNEQAAEALKKSIGLIAHIKERISVARRTGRLQLTNIDDK